MEQTHKGIVTYFSFFDRSRTVNNHRPSLLDHTFCLPFAMKDLREGASIFVRLDCYLALDMVHNQEEVDLHRPHRHRHLW